MPRTTVVALLEYHPGNHGLTEKAIRDQPPSAAEQGVPVLSGSSDNERPRAWIRRGATTADGKPVMYYEGPCLVLTKDGSAGLLTYQDVGLFTLNHHACVLLLRPEWNGRVDLEWFAWQYRQYFVRWTTSQSDNRVLSRELINSAEVELPDTDVQTTQLARMKTLLLVASKLRAIGSVLQEFLEQSCGSVSSGGDGSVRLGAVFECKGGLSGLTEDYIYHHAPSNGESGLDVVTGASGTISPFGRVTQEAASALVRGDSRREFVFHGPALVVARKGKAGLLAVIELPRFVTNDDAYVLQLRPDYVDKIDLHWFAHAFRRAFLDSSTSKADNATFSKSKFEGLNASFPSPTEQRLLGTRLKAAEELSEMVDRVLAKIDGLLSCQIA